METQLQKSIRMLWSNISWRVLYCDEIELFALHGRVTRNAVDKDGFEGWRTKAISEITQAMLRTERVAKSSGIEFKQSAVLTSMLNDLTKIDKWKELGRAFDNIVKYLRNVYNQYAPQGEDAPRVVSRFTETNRLGWTKQQWDHYLNNATPTFRRMIANIKKLAPVSEIRSDAQSLYLMFQSGKGILAYPGLDRLFRDLLDQLDQVQKWGATTTLNRQQSIILANQYDKKILPRLHMLWLFARQERPNG